MEPSRHGLVKKQTRNTLISGSAMCEEWITRTWVIALRRLHSSFIVLLMSQVEVQIWVRYITVITSYPFVIQEKGWGQFEIQIKIYLKGSFESPLVVNHMLKLYSSSNQNTPLSKKPVVHEQQDEMVFVNPKVCISIISISRRS